MKQRVVIWGGYGWGNVGDELTLAVAVHDLRQQGVNRITILTPTPGYTKALFPDADVIPYRPVAQRNKLLRAAAKACEKVLGISLPKPALLAEMQLAKNDNWVSALQQADCLYLVGGGYFSSLFSIFDRFLLPVEVAKQHGIPVATAPLGIGPFDDKRIIKKFVNAFQGASLVVRDETSASFCRDLGLEVEIKRDDGFRVTEILDFDAPSCVQHKLPRLGVNFFPQHGANNTSELRNWWLEFLRIAVKSNIQVEGFCFHNQISEDFEAMVDLFSSAGLPAQSVLPPVLDFREACRNLSSYSAIVSSRFHAVVVANATGIPCLGVSSGAYYHAKMRAACEGSTKAHHIPMTEISPFTAFELLIASRSISSINQ